MSRRCRPGRDRNRPPGPAAAGNAVPDQRGMVTAELAVALPVLVLAGLLAVTGVQLVSAQLRCLDAAGLAARFAARGELAADVDFAARAAAPRDAHIAVARADDVVSARVAATVHLPGFGTLLPAFTVTASAVAPLEPGAAAR